ncbi:MAG TPA: hypothetical protein VK891_08220 [Euzebyales bacterium]|nr:hypothetical protein [Euzebyales bacterium]
MSGPWIVAFVALAVLQVATLVVVIGVLRQVLPLLGGATHQASHDHAHGDGVIMAPAMGPAAGTRLPELTASTADGREVTAGDLADGPVVLLFVDEACGPCRPLVAALRDGELRLSATRLCPVIDDGADPAYLPPGPGIEVLRQRGGAVAAALGIDATPSAVTLRDGVVVDSCIVSSPAHLQQLVDQVNVAPTAP